MSTTDLTIEILKGIRAGVEATNARIDTTNSRLDATNARLESTNERLDSLREETSARLDLMTRRIVESEIRTHTAITDLTGTVRELTGVLRAQSDLRPRVERCEHEIEELKRGHSTR